MNRLQRLNQSGALHPLTEDLFFHSYHDCLSNAEPDADWFLNAEGPDDEEEEKNGKKKMVTTVKKRKIRKTIMTSERWTLIRFWTPGLKGGKQ